MNFEPPPGTPPLPGNAPNPLIPAMVILAPGLEVDWPVEGALGVLAGLWVLFNHAQSKPPAAAPQGETGGAKSDGELQKHLDGERRRRGG